MKSRNEKLKLYILLSQAVGLLVTLLCSLLGGLYIFDGEWLYAFPLSIVFVVSMYYLVIFFCKEKENRTSKGYPPIFYYLFGVYAVMSIILSFFVLHFYNVEINEKEEIQEIGMNKLKGIKLIYSSYDRQYTQFLSNLQGDLNRQITEYKAFPEKRSTISTALLVAPYNMDQSDINSIVQAASPSNSIQGRINERKKGFLNTRNTTLTRQNSMNVDDFDKFIDDQKNIIEGWDRFNLGKSLSDLDERITEDYDALNDYLKEKTADNYKIEIETQYYLGETLLNKPFDLASKHLSPSTFLILLFFQVLILLPYFLTKGKIIGINFKL
jgi:hypothetical protein